MNATFTAKEDKMKAYLQENLCSAQVDNAAAVIDSGKNMVRLVCSEKAGMGKL